MIAKLAWAALCAVAAAGCAGVPRWDATAFPNQAYYDETTPAQQAMAERKK